MSESNSLNPWNYKPWWCQPWSILLTGVTAIAGSWLLLHKIWITILVALPILTWMGFFLLIWPQLMRESGILAKYEEMRKQHESPK
ncbi:DUF6737 family protein [Phormidium sp. CCY1219]|uniref:DUF6737 family protein n=1 Tax=Phormidium sp. CCY1219 TaxID=2886104 RepID=UPI002D1F38D1|nr:DUF6737 family protein [Phormidium sp. CCY1219]MEB3827807.1 hypothetical protein [Phormidium sp. CCY1219]